MLTVYEISGVRGEYIALIVTYSSLFLPQSISEPMCFLVGFEKPVVKLVDKLDRSM